MSAQLAPAPIFRSWDNNGLPLVGGQLFTYAAGTTNPQATYTDSTQGTPNTNPVILNFRGEASVWLNPTLAYKFVLQDSLGNLIWTEDNIPGSAFASSGSLIPTTTNTFTLGSPSFTWANAYFGPNGAPVYDTANGNIGYYPRTAAEISASVTPTSYSDWPWIYDVRRCGVVPNSPSAGAANYTALKALFNPSLTGPTGTFIFPNTTGADIYYIGAAGSTCVLPMRDGCHLDLCGSTIQFTGTGTSADTNSGMFFALHDLVVENGSINVSWATGVSTGSGAAICVGARPTGSTYFQVTDSLLSTPLGNISLKKLRLNIAVTGAGLASAGGIALLGGIQGIALENIYINGNATLQQAITYEFGFATTTQPVQSSHMNEASFKNIRVTNCDINLGYGLVLTGAYNVFVDGYYCTDCANPILVNAGEANNFNPWASKDNVGAKHNISIKNVVARAFTNVGIQIAGAQKITPNTGYLSWKFSTVYSAGQIVINDPNMYTCSVGGTSLGSGSGPSGTGTGIADGTVTWNWLASSYPFTGGTANSAWPNETDLYDVTMENIVLDGSTNSGTYGIWNLGSGRMHVTGAVLQNCGRGIVATDESVIQVYNGVIILNSQQYGMQLDSGSGIWSPVRGKKVEIRNCYIAGSSRSSAGSFFAIHLNACDSAIIENNRFGYETGYAGFADASQAGALFLSATTASNVICRGNRCATPVGAGNASFYSVITGTGDCNGNSITNNSGDQSARGNWITDFQSASAQSLSNGSTIAVSFTGGSPSYALRSVLVTNSGAVTGVILQKGYHACQEISVINQGTGSITFDVQGTSNVVDGTSDVIAVQQARRYVWNTAQSLWYPCK